MGNLTRPGGKKSRATAVRCDQAHESIVEARRFSARGASPESLLRAEIRPAQY